jgi:hypothetical protein
MYAAPSEATALMPERDDQLLFCPFCKECFENATVCPDHELPLVPFDALPKAKHRGARDDDALAMHDLRFGRGLLAASFALIFVGFMLPMITTTLEHASTVNGFEVASRVAPNFWAVPLVGAAFVSILFRRRTPRKMRGVRLAIPVLGIIGATSLAFTLHRIFEGAEKMSERYGQDVVVSMEPGVWVMALGLLLSIVAGFRFGVTPEERRLPHGAGPEALPDTVVPEDEDED